MNTNKDNLFYLQEKIRKSKIGFEIHQEELEKRISELEEMGIKVADNDKMLSRIKKEIVRMQKLEDALLTKLENKILEIERKIDDNG